MKAELVGVDDMLGYILWARYFMQEQGYDMDPSLLYQDNMSAICWRSSISVLVLILMLVSTGRGRRIHLARKIPF